MTILGAGAAALGAWVTMWIVFHCQTCLKTNLELKDERLRVEAERIELEEKRAARKRLRQEEAKANKAETDAWITAENEKAAEIRHEREALARSKRPLWESTIWMPSSPRPSTSGRPPHSGPNIWSPLSAGRIR